MTASASKVDRQPFLVGANLVLRPIHSDDFDELYALASDPLIWAQHPEPTRWQRPVFERFFDDMIASGGALAAIDQATGRLIGASRFQITSEGDLEIGWSFLSRTYWGGPTNAEMKRLMIDHAFETTDSIIFRIGANNARSRRAVEKLGAVLEGTLESARGPAVKYRLRRDDWIAGRRSPALAIAEE
jgi:RimJ/RimL family protein N-acetyltransferase